MNVGFIGLGLMGMPCALNLLKAGHSVSVWARQKEAAEPALEKGAKWFPSIVELAKNVDTLFTNLTDTPDVEEVLLGAHGVVHCGNKNLTVIDMSTISATATREMAKKMANCGIELVDAPVSGGTLGAEQGTLTIMVGASEATFDRIAPLLSAMGKSITRIGECGAGQIAKSCNQIIITGTMAAIAEAITLATAADVDFHPIREALMGGFASSRVLEVHAKRMLDSNYAPGFKASLHVKDMQIVEGIAAELGLDLPISAAGLTLLRQCVTDGYGNEDSSAVLKVVEKKHSIACIK